MKPKNIFRIMAVITILLSFSTSQGADKFYFGSYGGEEYASTLKDSLKFNIVRTCCGDLAGGIDSVAKYGLRAIRLDFTNDSPSSWSWNSHYTLWEAEGLEGSYYKLSYNGGTLVNDPSASGGKARRFPGPATPRLIQWGPRYYQEPGHPTNPIQYTAEFRLKYLLSTPLGPMAPSPPTPVCRIMVVDRDTILKADTLYKSDFAFVVGYKTFELRDYIVPDGNSIEFRIYWYGITGALYIDYVKVYDQNGWRLIDEPTHYVANQIKTYASQEWTKRRNTDGDTVIYRWYMRDEPPSMDYYRPTAYIDSLLGQISSERVGFQAFWRFSNPDEAHEYLLRQNPKDICFDIFPIGGFGHDTTGSTYQDNWSTQIGYVNFAKTEAESLGKDFWLVPQAWTWADTLRTPCNYDTIHWHGTDWCAQQRDPSRYELRLQTFLGLCYGADGILYYPYTWWVNNNGHLETGLYDPLNNYKTYKWREIKEFTGPRVQKLGPLLKQLTWLGTCSDDSVGSFTLRDARQSYIYNIVPRNHFPPHVEVGFFKGSDEWGTYDYFMLVNRRCLASEGDSFRVFIEKDTVWQWYVEDIYSGFTWEIPQCGHDPQFTVSLEPGEGKLFKLYKVGGPWHKYVLVGPNEEYSTIQAGIDAAEYFAIVLVDTGTYRENINFKGKSIMVTSKFHTTGDTSYISRTIIDGSHFTNSDSASVVRFVSGESYCSCIKGFTLKNGSGTKVDYAQEEIVTKNGGGICCKNSSPTITNNIIVSNDSGIGMGGGIFCSENSSPKILNNIIKQNRAGYGGGICGGSPQTIIANNLIVQNVASAGGGGIDLACGIITNNTIDGDSAGSFGGGIYVSGTTCQIVNNIIVNSQRGRGIWCGGTPETISYNNVWNNSGGNFNCSGYGYITRTNRNGTPCDSFYNISQNPNYVDGYHLASSSACIDAGDNNAPALPAFDFDGNKRVADDPQNDTFFVDMGAYEYQPGGFEGFGKIVGGGKDTETKSSVEIADKFSVLQNYPNPFNPVTVMQFKITLPAKVSLKIYNILGQLVRVLVDEEKPTGIYQAIWDGKDAEEEDVASGIYFYRLQAGEFNEVGKMVLMK